MVHCDFCGKSQDEVFVTIMGNNGSAICSECILTSASIVVEQMKNNMEKNNNKIYLKREE